MAIGALVVPASVEDAAARCSEYMGDHPETGLIGLIFSSVEQLERALIENKWEIEQRLTLARSDIARTFRIDIRIKKGSEYDTDYDLSLIVNEMEMGTAQVLNVQVRTPESPLEEYDRREAHAYPDTPKFVPKIPKS